ncbi:MAG: DPP IV N-terminal domain-containing protein [Janthinobacterium lividum]
MKQLVLLLALLLAAAAARAQAPARLLTPEAAFLDPALRVADLAQLSWIPGTAHDFAYVRPAAAGRPAALLRGSAIRSGLTTVVTLRALLGALREVGVVRPVAFAQLQWQNAHALLLPLPGRVLRYDVRTGCATELYRLDTVSTYGRTLHPPTASLAYTKLSTVRRGREEDDTEQLYVTGPNCPAEQVRVPTNPSRPAQLLTWPRWSPSGQQLLFRKHYPTQGNYLYRVADAHVTRLFDRNNFSLRNFTFAPDERQLYVAGPDEWSHRQTLLRYDTSTGEQPDTLFTEPAPPVDCYGQWFVPGRPQEFVWLSARSGWPQLYLYRTSGRLLRPLTAGPALVTDVLGFSPDGREVVYASTRPGSLATRLYAAPLAGGAPRQLTPEAGLHTGALSPDGRYLLTRFSSPTEPLRVQLRSVATGRLVRTLWRAPDPLAAYALGTTSLVPLADADSAAPLVGRLLLPPGFDPARRYPLVLEVGQGPPALHLSQGWRHGADPQLLLLAQQGYVVLSVENRSYLDLGAAFADEPQTGFYASRFWPRPRWHAGPGEYRNDNGETEYFELADLARVLRQAKALPGVDSSRVALLGRVSPYTSNYLVREFQGSRKLSILVFPNGSGGGGPPGSRHLVVTYRPEHGGQHTPATAVTGPVDYEYCPTTGLSPEAVELEAYRVIVRYLAAYL